MKTGQSATHIKTGNEYVISYRTGVKLFGRWFYFVAYTRHGVDMIFMRTERNFLAKFKLNK